MTNDLFSIKIEPGFTPWRKFVCQKRMTKKKYGILVRGSKVVVSPNKIFLSKKYFVGPDSLITLVQSFKDSFNITMHVLIHERRLAD